VVKQHDLDPKGNAGVCAKKASRLSGSWGKDLDQFPRLLDEPSPVEEAFPALDATAIHRLAMAEAMVGRLHGAFAGKPFSAEWFMSIEEKRHGKHGVWLPRHLEFARHEREKVLCLGDCLGTDWVKYAAHGADVTIATSARFVEPIRMNFKWRGMNATILTTDSGKISWPDESADVIAANWITDDEAPKLWAPEVIRLLKPGGKILALAKARWNLRELMRLHWWKPRNIWTRSRLAHLLPTFEEIRVRQRQIRRSEVPAIIRFIPMPLLERLAGNALVLKAFKPLSVIGGLRTAA